MKYLLALLFFSCFATSLATQVSSDQRIEFESDEEIGRRGATHFGEYGIILRAKSREHAEDGDKEWIFRHLDQDLKEVKQTKLRIPRKMFLAQSETYDNKLFSLFKDRKGRYELAITDAKTFETTVFEGAFPRKAVVDNMVVLNDYVYLEAISRREPNLVLLNWKNGRNRLIPLQISGYKSRKIRVQNVQSLAATGEIFVFMQGLDSRKKSELFVLQLDGEGNRVKEYKLSDELEENIISISVNSPNPQVYNFVGTYSNSSNSTAEGLFNCLVENDAISYFNSYPFLELDNFLTYLPERKQKKVERKKARKEKKGKAFAPSYRIATHDIVPTDDGYLLLGEAYYATYRTEIQTTYTTINGVSTPSTNYQSVFDGYQYTHAILCKFDHDGNLIWDQSFKMEQTYKPYYIKRFISLTEQQGEQIDMVFSSGNRIYSKSIGFGGDVLKDEELTQIDTGDEDDKVKRSFSNLEYWYDNYFFVFGYQKIKNKGEDKEKRGKRKVYFVNKVAY